MKKFPLLFIAAVILLSGFNSCRVSYQSQTAQYVKYRIDTSLQKDAATNSFLMPYTDSVNKSMNSIVGIANETMDKKLPESELGNFMVDAFYTMANEKYHVKADAAVFNYGGIRLNQLPKGPVNRGKIFELMPFDNLLILQKVKGSVLQELLNLMAARGGWPVAGISYEIQISANDQGAKKAVNIKIQNLPIDADKIYTIVNSDFLANGGDNADMLRPIPQITNGYLMRDALFDYINFLKKQGKNIQGTIEKRVMYAQ